MFEKELACYQKNEEELLKYYENQFIAIKYDRFLGAYTTQEEAFAAALEAFGCVPFLIKHVTREEESVGFPALATGVVNVNKGGKGEANSS